LGCGQLGLGRGQTKQQDCHQHADVEFSHFALILISPRSQGNQA
jgi:hypothetical protein